MPDIGCKNRKWLMRRVVITKDQISFAFVDEEAQIDHIPFAEVLHVKEMLEAPAEASSESEDSTKFRNVLQIATNNDGYNSGRIYYLSTDSQETLKELITDLTKKAKTARVQAEARTGFRKLQRIVRNRYDSAQFQGLMALLIAAVRTTAHDSHMDDT